MLIFNVDVWSVHLDSLLLFLCSYYLTLTCMRLLVQSDLPHWGDSEAKMSCLCVIIWCYLASISSDDVRAACLFRSLVLCFHNHSCCSTDIDCQRAISHLCLLCRLCSVWFIPVWTFMAILSYLIELIYYTMKLMFCIRAVVIDNQLAQW